MSIVNFALQINKVLENGAVIEMARHLIELLTAWS
jgi:hypothetical protein